MRAHYLQHVAFEGLGSISPWLNAAGFETTCTRFFKSEGLPDFEGIDLLIVMGGPMSVNDEEKYPWLVDEKRFIKGFIETGKPVVGICLGAQLIANAAGAKVYPNADREIGWFPIDGLSPIPETTFRFPAQTEVFHWHGETFDLPAGAIHLASSPACQNQAFQLGRSVLGLQFHLEATPASTMDIVAHCREELVPAAYVQSESEILAASQDNYRTINNLMGELLSFLIGNSC